MKQKQYILYRYKINCVFIWVDFIKQGKIPCLFFSRDRTFSPPENGASSACLKASCRRSQPQAASVFDRRQQDAARFHMPQGKRSAGMPAVASRAASAGPALSNVPDGTRHFPQQADKTDAFYNRHWKPNGSLRAGAQMSMRERSQGKGGMPGSLHGRTDARALVSFFHDLWGAPMSASGSGLSSTGSERLPLCANIKQSGSSRCCLFPCAGARMP